MSSIETEPFPALQESYSNREAQKNEGQTRRRNNSVLGAELPGDSSVPAFATTTTAPPASPIEGSRERPTRRSKRRTIKRVLSRWKRLCIRHTWLLPLVLMLFTISLYLVNPSQSNPISAALFLSYPLPRAAGSDPTAPIKYGKGARDFAFVAFYAIVFSFTREFLMQRLIRPIALHFGIRNKAKQARFLEQFYTAMYFSVFGPLGLWIMSRGPIWYFNTTAMYEGFPHRTLEGVFKAYYLLQASYWAQQMAVMLLMLEAPRKDFKELVAHHFITLTLIWCSYRFHFTHMGIAIYITHDVSDVFLATSKVLNYIDSPITGPFFVLFMGVWAYLRHFLNLKILWSIVTEFSTVGPFELNWETQQYKCWISQYITFALLASLQAVNLFWWFLICRIAYRFVAQDSLADERSDYEEDDAEEDAEKEKDKKKSATGSKKAKSNGSANGSMANGVPETPKILINGNAPTTPERETSAVDAGSIASRVRQRNKAR